MSTKPKPRKARRVVLGRAMLCRSRRFVAISEETSSRFIRTTTLVVWPGETKGRLIFEPDPPKAKR